MPTVPFSHSEPDGSRAPSSMDTSARATNDAETNVTVNATAKNTIAFAVSTRAREGHAVIVVRIMPVPYSEAVVSTPSVMMHMLPSSNPKKPRPSGFSPARSPEEELLDTSAPAASPMPTTSSTNMPSVHIVERTDLIFVHSEATACPRCVRTTGMGEVYPGYDAPGAACHWGAAAAACGIGGWWVLIG